MLLFGFLFLVSPVLSYFGPENSIYNDTEARMLLNIAAAAYAVTPDGCLSRTFPPSEDQQLLVTFSEQCDFVGNPCAGYIIASNALRQITVVFRGTKTNTQLALEGWTTLKPKTDFFGLGLVNRYFKTGHDKTWSYVQTALTDPRYSSFDVYVTGHSLGGALAALAAPRIVHDGLRQSNQVKVITFGEPRVGNIDFARSYDQLIPYSFRVVHSQDIVPHLPGCVKDLSYVSPPGSDGSLPCDPDSTNGGYHHAVEIWYPDNMTPGSNYMVCTGLPKNEDFGCSDKAKVYFNDTTLAIWDHRNYFAVSVSDEKKPMSVIQDLLGKFHGAPPVDPLGLDLVPTYGKDGCDPSVQFPGPPTDTGLKGLVSSLFGRK